MPLLASTEHVLEQVREKTGIPVEITDDQSLTVHATVVSARPGLPFHFVKINSRMAGQPDYLIAFQCGFILRQAELPPSDRWQFALSDRAVDDVQKLITPKMSGMGLEVSAVKQLAAQLASGLLTQLRSVPIGIRIDRWIKETYPELQPLQVSSLRDQCSENAQALSPQVRSMYPATLWKGNGAMNAAHAIVASEIAVDRTLTLPYEAAGLLAEGENLLRILEAIPDVPEHDKALVNAWGIELGINDWYQFAGVQQ